MPASSNFPLIQPRKVPLCRAVTLYYHLTKGDVESLGLLLILRVVMREKLLKHAVGDLAKQLGQNGRTYGHAPACIVKTGTMLI